MDYSKTKWIIRTDVPYQGWTQSFLNENGTVGYTDNQTFEQYNESKGGVMKLITNDELDALNKTHRESMITEWVEISEEFYYEQLEVLPPIYRGIAFFICEAYMMDLHACYLKWEGKYYESRRSVYDKEKTIVESLINQLKSN